MEARYKVLGPQDIPHSSRNAFAIDVLEGLSRNPKQIPSLYFYDAQGSLLFQKITDLEEYYLTRCEFEILEASKEKISRFLGEAPFNLIELGAGDGRKTLVLLEYFLRQGYDFQYIPLDISEEAMIELIDFVEARLSSTNLKIRGCIAEYFDACRWLSRVSDRRNLVLFLGSSIGNFDYAGARRFLQHLWNALNHDDLTLIGFDLKKNPLILERAYDDSQGLTREFNLNLLDRINRELGGEFNRDKFVFRSHYSARSGAVESWLMSTEPQEVAIRSLGRSFKFQAAEGIHTEYSYKYLESDIRHLARDSGFEVEELLYDNRRYFADALWRVRKH